MAPTQNERMDSPCSMDCSTSRRRERGSGIYVVGQGGIRVAYTMIVPVKTILKKVYKTI